MQGFARILSLATLGAIMLLALVGEYLSMSERQALSTVATTGFYMLLILRGMGFLL